MGIAKIFERVLAALSTILLVLMACSVMLQVVGRHILSDPPAWTEEFGRYIIVWLVAVGAGLNLKQHGYKGAIEFMSELMPARLDRAIRILFMLFILGFLCVLCVTGWDAVQRNFDVRTAALELPLAYVYLGIAVMAALMIFGIVYHLIAETQAFFRPPADDTPPEETD